MMCRVVNILLFSLLILMVFSSCEHRELVDPQNTHYVRVYLDEQIRNVTFGFYNETYERPEYVRPSVLRAVLADPQSGKIVNERILRNHGKDERGHYIDGYIVASAGTYNFMVYEQGSAVTLVREANNFYQMQAYTNPISERYLQYIPTIRKEIDEDNIMNSPDHMFHEVCQGVTIKNSTEIDTLFNLQGDFFTAQSLASSYYIQIKVKGIEWITTAVSLMKGVAGSKYLCNKGELVSSDSVHVFFGMNYIDKKRIAGEDISQATLYATFSTFGMIQDAPLIGEQTLVTLEFGHKNFDEIDIKTKATLDIRQESRVLNMYVYIFDSSGQRIYSHFFNRGNMVENQDAAISSNFNCWYVNTADDGTTSGVVRIKAPQITGATLFLVANIDEDMLNVSSERLNTIQSISELESMNVHLTQQTTSRNGYFPMVAKLSGVAVTQTEINTGGKTAYLERLDSKVTVNVKLADNSELKAFIPEVCKIKNLPLGSRVVNSAASDFEEAGYFDSQVTFDEQITNAEGDIRETTCSFYMLENRESGNLKNSVTAYHDRDRRIKGADGSYDTSDGMWLNAPEKGTYLEIHGELHMRINTSLTGMQELIGDVVYYIHLGDFKSSVNNYDIERNTHYTYNITINGVDNIRVEVETEVENQPGATGHVYSATETQFTFDAHYGQRVFVFNAEEVDTGQMTFYVNTPFGREGTPELPGGGYDVSDLDYKWVKFLINEIDESTGAYSLNNRLYPGDNNEMLISQGSSERLMNVAELLDFMKREKNKYLEYKQGGFSGENPSKYLKAADGEYYMNVTAFVDEYYYHEHPTENRAITWKDFVNQPNRLMHILCSTRTSNDGESSVTGSIITIRQRSIQTPYNLAKGSVTTAFGCEVVDETREDNMTFYENDNNYENVDFGNDARSNGLYNTACLWNMFDSGVLKTGFNRERWDTYLDYEVPNRDNDGFNHFLKDGLLCMRYAVMSRNRDNNGDGYIDPQELKWYIASLEQLYALYIGDLGINSDAQLYPSSMASLPNSQVNGLWQWRNHIVASNKTTITNSGQYISPYWPDMLWAEEGVSISGYGQEWQKQSPKSIRCIRNLGIEDATESTIVDKSQNVPAYIIIVEGPTDGVYRFDLSNINENSIRFYTTHELIPNNEYGESSRTYYGFETYDEFTSYTDGYIQLKEDLERGLSPCPEGYRVPNVREAALMSLYCSSNWWDDHTILSCSYYSHGSLGGDLYYDNGTTTWFFESNYVTISSTANSLRCVRDIIE